MNLSACSLWRSTTRQATAIALLLMATTCPVGAQDRSATSAPFAPQDIQANITYLASDALRGRGSGEPGNEKAAQFIAAQFAKNGVVPLGTRKERDPNAPLDGSGYYQPFRFIAGRAVGKKNALQTTLTGKTRSYRLTQDFEPSGISGGGTAEGDVVFVGYGIHAPQINHDDFAGNDVKGKIVLVLSGNPKQDPHSPLVDFAGLRRKALAARELGATAVLVVPPPNPDAQGATPWEFANTSDAGLPVLRVKRPVVDAWFHQGTPGVSLEQVERNADQDSITALRDVHVRLVADIQKVEKITANIVGLIPGSDPTLKDEYVVVGAHMDHLGMGGPASLAKSTAPAIHHGADDNASGAAGVVEIARYFSVNPKDARRGMSSVGFLTPAAWYGYLPIMPKPKRSILVICFSGEELGLLGSDHYVNHPILPLAKTVAMLNMDMVGRLRDNKLIVSGSGTATEWDGLLNQVNAKARFNVIRSESGFGASDQQSFYVKDMPVLFFFTGIHEDYHTPTDTADKINAQGEGQVVRMVADCALEIANSPTRPTFRKNGVQDQSAPSRGVRVYFGSVPDYAVQVEGVQLSGVRVGSPAEKAGLKAGDIIIKFGDTTVKNIQDYVIALSNFKPGDTVDVVIKRAGQVLTLKTTLAARKE